MKRRGLTSAIASGLAVCMFLVARSISAQGVAFRVGAIDMYGGAVFSAESDPGVVFGGRVSLLDLFDRALQAGFELEWWTAERSDAELEVRDIVAGVAFLTELSRTGLLRPYLGFAAGLHSVDTSRVGGDRFLEGESAEAERISGCRAGASGFAGLAVRLTGTGSIWLILEYRYTAVSELPHHELRGGARLLASPL